MSRTLLTLNWLAASMAISTHLNATQINSTLTDHKETEGVVPELKRTPVAGGMTYPLLVEIEMTSVIEVRVEMQGGSVTVALVTWC